MAFDPYHKWLAIPKELRPPTYYQLLAVAPDETDLEVIEEAAIRQSTHLRAYQVGPHAVDCTRLLNEISAARSTLLNPAKRREYDAKLGLNHAVTAAAQTASAQTAVTRAAPRPQFELQDDEPGAVVVRRSKPQPIDIRRKHSPLLYVAIGGGVASLLLVILVIVLLTRPTPAIAPPPAVAVVKKPVPPEVNRLAPPEENVPAPPDPKSRPPKGNAPIVNQPVNPPKAVGNPRPPVQVRMPSFPPPGPEREPDGPGVIRLDGDQVSHLHFVPGQRKALFVSSNAPAKPPGFWLWDIDARAGHRWFPSDKGTAFCVAVSADGTWALGGEVDQLRRLDLVTGADRVLPWPNIYPREISIAPDGKQALMVGYSRDVNRNKIVLFDVANPQRQHELASENNNMVILGWADAGQTAVIRCGEDIRRFERSEGRRTSTSKMPAHLSLTGLSRDGIRLVSWTPFKLITFDATGPKQLFHTELDRGYSFMPPMLSADGRWIAFTHRDAVTRIDGKTGIKERTWQASRSHIHAAALSADGAQALTWSQQDKAIRLWDLNQPPSPPFSAAPAKLGFTHRTDGQQYVQLLPMEGDQCLSLVNQELTVCRLPTLEPVRPLVKGLGHTLHSGGYQAPWVLLSSHNQITKINVANGQVETLPIAEQNLRALTLSRSGKYLGFAVDRSVKLWDGAGKKLIAQRDDLDHIHGLVFFKNEERCLVASSNGLYLLELPTLATIKKWSNHTTNVVLSPDERLAAFYAYNGVFVFDVTTEQFVGAPVRARSNTSAVTLGFLGDGAHLAFADGEAICIYNVREQKETAFFPYEAGPIHLLNVAGDGRTIITRRDAGNHIWQVSKDLLP